VLSLDVGEYSKDGEQHPLREYAVLAVFFNAIFGGFLCLVERRGLSRELAKQATPGNLLLLGVATHKLSRLIAKDWVTSPLRAPFTTYEGAASGPEVNESPRGRGMQRALGQLLT
jgi:hypothetical protein